MEEAYLKKQELKWWKEEEERLEEEWLEWERE